MAHEIEVETGGVRLVDVLPLSIGVAREGRRFLRIFGRHTPVPTERSFLVRTTEDRQSRHELPVFQGESPDCAENEYLGSIVIANIPPAPAGRQSYDLSISLDEQSTMTVSAREERSGARVPVRLERLGAVDTILAPFGEYDGPAIPGRKKRPVSRLGKLFSKMLNVFARRSRPAR